MLPTRPRLRPGSFFITECTCMVDSHHGGPRRATEGGLGWHRAAAGALVNAIESGWLRPGPANRRAEQPTSIGTGIRQRPARTRAHATSFFSPWPSALLRPELLASRADSRRVSQALARSCSSRRSAETSRRGAEGGIGCLQSSAAGGPARAGCASERPPADREIPAASLFLTRRARRCGERGS